MQQGRDSPEFKIDQVEELSVLVSLWRQIRAMLREPKVAVPHKQYRGEIRFPISEMKPWYCELPETLKELFAEPTDPIGIYNRGQEKKHLLFAVSGEASGLACGLLAAVHPLLVLLFTIIGFAAGKLVGAYVFKKAEYAPDIWQDFKVQKVSWLNSALVHAVAIAILVLPYVTTYVVKKPQSQTVVTNISPYLPPELAGPDKRTGGGGGGGDRSPTPASKGAIPKFARTQLAPPMAVLPNLEPKLAVQPTLLGPPELKLPQMSEKGPWGDLRGVLGPASNGPGTGGGIGTGEGTGIGSGRGGGFGPGEGGGFGGGAYSIGGGVSAPIPIYKPEPPYSEEARKAKYQGTVIIYIVVSEKGNVTDAQVVKPLGLGLDEKALGTVKTWKFKPGMRNGIPVPVKVMIEVSFRLL